MDDGNQAMVTDADSQVSLRTSATDDAKATGEPQSGSSSRRTVATPPPVLASEALREDVAPRRPWSRAFRVWDGILGIWFVLVGVAVQLGIWECAAGGQWIAYVFAVVLFVGALAPVPYVVRGVGSVVLGVVMLGMMVGRVGPMNTAAGGGGVDWGMVLYSFAAIGLAGALLFRSRYREFVGARWMVVVALVLAVPAAVYASIQVATRPGAAAVMAGAVLVAIAVSAVGLFGETMSGMSRVWSVILILVVGFERAVPSFVAGAGWVQCSWAVREAAVVMVACVLGGKGLAQILAYFFADQARRVDVMVNRRNFALFRRSSDADSGLDSGE